MPRNRFRFVIPAEATRGSPLGALEIVKKNKVRKIEVATVWRHREFLGRPAARYSAIFVFYMYGRCLT